MARAMKTESQNIVQLNELNYLISCYSQFGDQSLKLETIREDMYSFLS